MNPQHLAALPVILALMAAACGSDPEPNGQHAGTGGDGGLPGATGGMPGATGGSGPSGDVTPIERNGRHALDFDDIQFEVDPALGARIVTYSLSGTNLLSNGDGTNSGSTFWTSPQSDWGWPPPAEIDNSAYTASVEGNTIVMTGAANAALGVSVTKKFTADSASGAVIIEYVINNTSAASVQYAPWEITRVPAAGLTFYPSGPSGVYASITTLAAEAIQESAGTTWVDYQAAPTGQGKKLFGDGSSGWMAHVEGNMLFIKTFADIPQADQATGEGEIELYLDGAHRYVELEQQGAHTEIAPGASLSWTVRWYLEPLPTATTVEPGNTALVDLVNQTIP